MDKVRNRLDEARKSRNRKLLIGVLAVVFIMMCAFSVERNISNRIEDVSIDKSKITDEKAIFIPFTFFMYILLRISSEAYVPMWSIPFSSST